LRYRLLASAGLAAIALALGVTAATTAANAEDCGCRDRVRAALARQAPVVAKPAPVRRTPVRQGPCCIAAPAAPQDMVASNAHAEGYYDYRAQGAVNMDPYRQRWEAAPQGYVPPPQGYGAPMDPYGPPMEAPYGAPLSYAPPGPAQGMAYGQSYGEGWAYDYRPAITVDQGGWFGGVGYGMGADGGGGGGGGMTLTLAQPDASNGYAPGPMGAWGAANQVGQWRAEAFAPKASK
jgi:hypothetical protein